jgi:hypothetical protein
MAGGPRGALCVDEIPLRRRSVAVGESVRHMLQTRGGLVKGVARLLRLISSESDNDEREYNGA